MSQYRTLSLFLFTLWFCLPLMAGTPSVEGTTAYIISPAHGETVSSPFKIRFGLEGMGVAPAGIEREKTGHHHLLIDRVKLPALDKPLPADERLHHFGGGQTEAMIELTPGMHTLQILLGDKNHIPHTPPVVSERIMIRVK